MTKKKIIVVDDHPIVRKGFIQLINQEPDLTVVGEAEDAITAIEEIKKKNPDIVLVDLSLKESSGIELIKDLQKIRKTLPALVVSLHDENVYAERVLRAGAKGFIMKGQDIDELMDAIREVLNGGIYLSKKIKNKIIEKLAGGTKKIKNIFDVEKLSDRELEVFQLIGEGFNTKIIANKLNLSIKTVETYKAHLKTKLSLKDGTELMQRAIEWYINEKKDKI